MARWWPARCPEPGCSCRGLSDGGGRVCQSGAPRTLWCNCWVRSSVRAVLPGGHHLSGWLASVGGGMVPRPGWSVHGEPATISSIVGSPCSCSCRWYQGGGVVDDRLLSLLRMRRWRVATTWLGVCCRKGTRRVKASIGTPAGGDGGGDNFGASLSSLGGPIAGQPVLLHVGLAVNIPRPTLDAEWRRDRVASSLEAPLLET